MADLQATLVGLARSSPWIMEILRAAREVNPRDWAVAAGAVRTLVWDDLHGFDSPSRLNDVDVLFFDLARPSESALEDELRSLAPDYEWEAKNQAFIHEWYARNLKVEIPPYRSMEAGIAGFVETATAVGLRLERDDSIAVIAPYGLEDLFTLSLRPNLDAPDPSYFEKRVVAKKWLEHWPRLRTVAPN